jgi:hypothetical protein
MTDVKTILGVPVAQVKSVSNIPITDVKTILGSNVNLIDYSGIIASLNLLTDTTDTEYDGTNPTLAGMETELNAINGEIITP